MSRFDGARIASVGQSPVEAWSCQLSRGMIEAMSGAEADRMVAARTALSALGALFVAFGMAFARFLTSYDETSETASMIPPRQGTDESELFAARMSPELHILDPDPLVAEEAHNYYPHYLDLVERD